MKNVSLLRETELSKLCSIGRSREVGMKNVSGRSKRPTWRQNCINYQMTPENSWRPLTTHSHESSLQRGP